VRVEERAVERDGVTHDVYETIGLFVEHGYDHVLQLVVQRGGMDASIIVSTIVPDRPAGDVFDAPLDPPAVQDAERRNSVERRFHAARPRSLHRRTGRVEPDVGSRGHQPGKRHIVVRQVDQADRVIQLIPELPDVLDSPLSLVVVRMGFACEHELQRTYLATQPIQTI